MVIFDAFSGFDVDAFTRAAGLIKAPGLLLLLRPADKQWLQQHDPFNVWQDNQLGYCHFLTFLHSKSQ